MRFTTFHCHNPACGYRVWVSAQQLGKRVRCPACGTMLNLPADWPPDQFFDGPPVLQEKEEPSAAELAPRL